MPAHPFPCCRTTIVRLLVLFALLIAARAIAAPVVSNLTASQRTGTRLVDVRYDLAAPGFPTVAVSLAISSDGGVTWTVPATSVSGAIGISVAPGTGKVIVWDAGADWPSGYSTQMRFRVTADDVEGLSFIPGGSFTMGRTSGDGDSDAPPVTVTVSAFYMQKTETTKAQWDEVRAWGASNGFTDLRTGYGKAANHPVESVTWWDVVKWCNARSAKEGLTPVYTVSGAVMRTGQTVPTANWNANGYRLPTEAEWEKAARGGVEGKRFPWGTETISHSEANFRNSGGEEYATGTPSYHGSYRNGQVMPYTSPVGSFAANGFGLNDMSGNVWEWCWDWYGGNSYVDGASDPRGASSGSNRVLRGGSWSAYAFSCRAAFRFNLSPIFTQISLDEGRGFRPARSSVP